MAKKKHWHYVEDAKTSKAGTMICCHCGKHISEGMYRFYETEDAYVSQHRECAEKCGGGERFAEMDAVRIDAERRQIAFEYSCKEFARLWGMKSADEFIL